MSVGHKGNGALRLHCDGDDCERKFVPQRPLTDPVQLRKRAELHGWRTKPSPTPQTSFPGTTSKETRDLCPGCGERP